jgi:hypothetical protein
MVLLTKKWRHKTMMGERRAPTEDGGGQVANF